MANNYLTFDGSTGFITVPDNAVLDFGTGDFSISVWLRFNIGTTNDNVLHKGSNPNPRYLLGLASNGALEFEADVGSDYVFAGTSAAVNDGVWRFFTIVKNSTSGKMYINSVLDSTDETGTYNINSDNAVDMLIGTDGVSASFFNGSMDDLRIYKGAALSQAQITAIYNGGAGTKYVEDETPEASAAWNIDEGTGTTITDEQNGLIGTFTGGVSWLEGGTPFAIGGAMNDCEALDEAWAY